MTTPLWWSPWASLTLSAVGIALLFLADRVSADAVAWTWCVSLSGVLWIVNARLRRMRLHRSGPLPRREG